MAKTCSKFGCSNAVFSKGLCSWHAPKKAMARNGRSGSTEPLKRYTTLPKRKTTGELAIFYEIWAEREHASYLSGKKLIFFVDPDLHEADMETFVKFFAHVLSKKQFGKYRLLKENIVLLTPYEHSLFDQGTAAKREEYAKKNNCSWMPLYEKVEQLLKSYPSLTEQ